MSTLAIATGPHLFWIISRAAGILALVIHAVSLLGDGILSPSIADLTVPFVSSFQCWWTTLEILSGWALILLSLSYYARTKIGIARWRVLHRFTALAWLGGLAHSLGQSSDASEPWFLVSVAAMTVPALALLAARLSQRAPSALPQTSHGPARAS